MLKHNKKNKKGIKNSCGTAAIEFAILLPLFLMFVAIILQQSFDVLASSSTDHILGQIIQEVEIGEYCRNGHSRMVENFCSRAWFLAFSGIRSQNCQNNVVLSYRQYPIEEFLENHSRVPNRINEIFNMEGAGTSLDTSPIRPNHFIIMRISVRHRRLLGGFNSLISSFTGANSLFQTQYIRSSAFTLSENYGASEQCT